MTGVSRGAIFAYFPICCLYSNSELPCQLACARWPVVWHRPAWSAWNSGWITSWLVRCDEVEVACSEKKVMTATLAGNLDDNFLLAVCVCVGEEG